MNMIKIPDWTFGVALRSLQVDAVYKILHMPHINPDTYRDFVISGSYGSYLFYMADKNPEKAIKIYDLLNEQYNAFSEWKFISATVRSLPVLKHALEHAPKTQIIFHTLILETAVMDGTVEVVQYLLENFGPYGKKFLDRMIVEAITIRNNAEITRLIEKYGGTIPKKYK